GPRRPGAPLVSGGPPPGRVVGAAWPSRDKPARSHLVRASVRPSDRRRNLSGDPAARAHRRPFRNRPPSVVAASPLPAWVPFVSSSATGLREVASFPPVPVTAIRWRDGPGRPDRARFAA